MSSVHSVDPAQRRRMAALLLAPAAVLLALGLTPVLLNRSVIWTTIGILIVGAGVLLFGIAAGLRRTAAQDERVAELAAAEAALDDAILASPELAELGCGENCGSCGVDDCAVKALPRS